MPRLGCDPSLPPCVLPWSRRPRLSMEEARERMLRCYRPTMRGGNIIWDTDGVRGSRICPDLFGAKLSMAV